MTVDLDRAINQLRMVLPHLDGAPSRPLSTAHRGSVVQIGAIVFRVANTLAVRAARAREGRLLPLLAHRLPLPVPYPRYQVPPSNDLPYGAMGYLALCGRSLDTIPRERLDLAPVASDVGRFLQALHTIPLTEVAQAGLPGPTGRRAEVEGTREMVSPVLRARLAVEEWMAVERWWRDLLSDRAFWHYSPVVLQGDLWDGNILVAEGRAAGIIDFEFAAIGDPAHDLGTQLRIGREFAGQVLAAYRKEGGVVDRAVTCRMQRHFELRSFSLIRHALEARDERQVEIAVRKLQEGPVLRTLHRRTYQG